MSPYDMTEKEYDDWMGQFDLRQQLREAGRHERPAKKKKKKRKKVKK